MRKHKNINKNERGVALVWALLFSMIILVIASSMAILVVKELRITTNIDESNRAYLAAESGMEEGLYRLKDYMTPGEPGDPPTDSIDWFCPGGGPVIFNKTLEGAPANLQYRGRIECDPSAAKAYIDISSTGEELGRTQRSLRTRITFVDPTDRIERFNTDPPISAAGGGQRSYPFPAIAVASAPLIIQQFDLELLPNSNNTIRVGMMDDSGQRVNVRVTRDSNSRSTFALERNGSVGSSVRINNTNVDPKSFRIKLEYAKYGSSYVVLRASIFKKNPPTPSGLETFSCANTFPANGNPILVQGYNGVSGFTPTRVLVDQGFWQNPAANNNNGYVRFSNGVRLDNMVFWSKE